ncbi:hypothetical protein BJ085DRAFT_36802 [Dimargaris cristalligena]|uniref:Uncharacterized protein n=1 Tax=Dimargaris cristalligena TaxID=215637 RepID=A0A4P9ZYV7_9FUNG|nr:hypothetical protein BJ085DRAFT_36802 [Dimargaris cristalligena]|eukprot:RKP37970.1 hypothetical protein BJ085DRAFT_36802 [Dimargaris cristalligena]
MARINTDPIFYGKDSSRPLDLSLNLNLDGLSSQPTGLFNLFSTPAGTAPTAESIRGSQSTRGHDSGSCHSSLDEPPVPSRPLHQLYSATPAMSAPVLAVPRRAPLANPSSPTFSNVNRPQAQPVPTLMTTRTNKPPSPQLDNRSSLFGAVFKDWGTEVPIPTTPPAEPLPLPLATPVEVAKAPEPTNQNLSELEKWALGVDSGNPPPSKPLYEAERSLHSTTSTSASDRPVYTSKLSNPGRPGPSGTGPQLTQSSVLSAIQNRKAPEPVAPPKPLLNFNYTKTPPSLGTGPLFPIESKLTRGLAESVQVHSSGDDDDKPRQKTTPAPAGKAPKSNNWLGGLLSMDGKRFGKKSKKGNGHDSDANGGANGLSLALDLDKDTDRNSFAAAVNTIMDQSTVEEQDDIELALLDSTSPLSKFLAQNANPIVNGGTHFRELPSGQLQAISALTELVRQSHAENRRGPLVVNSDVEDSDVTESAADNSEDEEREENKNKEKKSKGVSWKLPEEEAAEKKAATKRDPKAKAQEEEHLAKEKERVLLQRMLDRHRNEIMQGHGVIHQWMVNSGINPKSVLEESATWKEADASAATELASRPKKFTYHGNLSAASVGNGAPVAVPRNYPTQPVPAVPYMNPMMMAPPHPYGAPAPLYHHPAPFANINLTPGSSNPSTPRLPPATATGGNNGPGSGFYQLPHESLSMSALPPPPSIGRGQTHVSPFASRPGTPKANRNPPSFPLQMIEQLPINPANSAPTDTGSSTSPQPIVQAMSEMDIDPAQHSDTPAGQPSTAAGPSRPLNSSESESDDNAHNKKTCQVKDANGSDASPSESDSENEGYVSFRKKASHLTRPIVMENDEPPLSPELIPGSKKYKTNFKPQSKALKKAVYGNTFNSVGTPVALPGNILVKRRQEQMEEEARRLAEERLAALASSEEDDSDDEGDSEDSDDSGSDETDSEEGSSEEDNSEDDGDSNEAVEQEGVHSEMPSNGYGYTYPGYYYPSYMQYGSTMVPVGYYMMPPGYYPNGTATSMAPGVPTASVQTPAPAPTAIAPTLPVATAVPESPQNKPNKLTRKLSKTKLKGVGSPTVASSSPASSVPSSPLTQNHPPPTGETKATGLTSVPAHAASHYYQQAPYMYPNGSVGPPPAQLQMYSTYNMGQPSGTASSVAASVPSTYYTAPSTYAQNGGWAIPVSATPSNGGEPHPASYGQARPTAKVGPAGMPHVATGQANTTYPPSPLSPSAFDTPTSASPWQTPSMGGAPQVSRAPYTHIINPSTYAAYSGTQSVAYSTHSPQPAAAPPSQHSYLFNGAGTPRLRPHPSGPSGYSAPSNPHLRGPRYAVPNYNYPSHYHA